ncbi:MAG TPA: S9 family peptidase, partial [candidate division Zixibacteria bacterium]|nr:S9 family peptidase [candidate division Zixibacteria bacterium]
MPKQRAPRASGSHSRKAVRRALKAEDLFAFEMVTGAAISPDESRIAYTVESVDRDHRRYFNHIHVHDRQTGTCQQYTFGEVSDRGLSWSPDGSMLAFVSTRDKKNAIYLMPVDGGAERKLVELDGSFGELQWFPDGKSLLFSFTKKDSFDISDEKKKKEAPLYRHITRFFYRLDGAGFLPQDFKHIWRVSVATGEASQISKRKLDHESPVLSPDGKRIYFLACDKKDRDRYSDYVDVFSMPARGGAVRKLRSTVGPKYALRVSPDGKTLAYLGHDDPHDAWGVRNVHVWTIPAGGGAAQSKDLLPKFDRHCIDSTICDTGEVSFSGGMEFSADGKRIYFVSSDMGNTHLFYVPSRGGAPTRITHKPMHIKAFSVNGKASVAALVMTDLGRTPELYLVPTVHRADARMKRLTGVNDTTLKEIGLGRTGEVWFTGFDGTKLQGWVTLPPNFNSRKKYPAILQVHGGPRTQYGFSFFHEMNYLAAQGYVVFYTNPRGGLGRGETFAAAIAGGWGDLDYKDVMSAADWLEKQPYVNKKRLGITGGSYGGYMTNWVIGHTDRFKAAVTQRSVVDLSSFVGSSDIGYALAKEFDGQPWENPTNYHERSPLTHIGKHVKTPLLIIHSEQDLRCHIEQAEQLFVK